MRSNLVPRPSCAHGEESLASHARKNYPETAVMHARMWTRRCLEFRAGNVAQPQRTLKQLPCADEAIDLDPRSSNPTRRFLTLYMCDSVEFAVSRDRCLVVPSHAVYSVCLARRTAAAVAAYFGNFYLYDRQ